MSIPDQITDSLLQLADRLRDLPADEPSERARSAFLSLVELLGRYQLVRSQRWNISARG